MRDCVETYAREALIREASERYGIQMDHFTRRERAELTHPRTGPLSKILSHIRKSGYASRIGDFSSVSQHLTITEVHMAANRIVLENPLHFGISPSVVLSPRIPRRRMETLRELSNRQSPYTNVFTPGPDAAQPQRMPMNDLQNMITS